MAPLESVKGRRTPRINLLCSQNDRKGILWGGLMFVAFLHWYICRALLQKRPSNLENGDTKQFREWGVAVSCLERGYSGATLFLYASYTAIFERHVCKRGLVI